MLLSLSFCGKSAVIFSSTFQLSQYIMAQTNRQYPGLIQQDISVQSTPSHNPNGTATLHLNPYSVNNQVSRSYLTLGQQQDTNITMNPYNTYVDDRLNYIKNNEVEGLAATRRLRDSVYMSPQLVQLTNTLRRGKKVCQGGHSDNCQHVNDSTMLPEKEVVFRAVSPHGHVYWEIDPTRGTMGVLGDQPPPDEEPTVIVNPFADVNLLQSPNSKTSLISNNPASLNASPAAPPRSSSAALGERFNSLRAKSNKLNAKLNNQHYQLNNRRTNKDSNQSPSSSASSSSSTSGSSAALSSATASTSSTLSPPPGIHETVRNGIMNKIVGSPIAGVRSSTPLNATVDSILNSWSSPRQRKV